MAGHEITRALARSVGRLELADLSDEAREVARHCLLDTLGCAVAGASEELTEILVAEVAATEGSQVARLVGRTERASPRTAALVSGAAAHALDYDDTHMRMSGHPSVPVLPALLALSETRPLTGAELVTALVVGIETETRLGALMNPDHYKSGFHATGTLGVVGAAAACARAMSLDEDRFCHALALGATQAAGLKASFGSMAKPLHAGAAAQAGLTAALLARGGFTGNLAILESGQGFAAAYHGSGRGLEAITRFDHQFLIRDTLFKFHAACYLTHAGIDATNALLAEGVRPQDVRGVEVKISPELLKVCAIPEPATGLEGKFSVRGTIAMALLGIDTSDRHRFSDAQVTAPDYVAARDKVRLTTVDGQSETEATVVLDLGDRAVEATRDSGVPAKNLDEQWKKLVHKFGTLARPVLGDKTESLREAVERVESLERANALLDLAVPA